MKAVVWHGVADIRLDDVPEPTIEHDTDAIVRITRSAICGTDLHFVRGTMSGMREGTILGHEGVGIVEETGLGVRNFPRGTRVVIASTIACGSCGYCRAGHFAQCDNANPGGKDAGTAFFGGPQAAGGFDGMQAEFVRVPYAHTGLVAVPDEVSDDQAVLVSDIVPTGWFGAKLARIRSGDVVAVFGCGPVGQFAIASALLQGASRVIAVDGVKSRLEMARAQHAEVVDYNAEDPVSTIKDLTGGTGADRVIDAVGVDAERPKSGPAAEQAEQEAPQFSWELDQVAADAAPNGATFRPGDGPSQAVRWEVQACAKAGTLAIIGVYPPSMTSFPLGVAMNRNLRVNLGNCNHRKYLPQLLEMVRRGTLEPTKVLSKQQPLMDVISAYECFDRREDGWLKVALDVQP